MKRSTHWLLLAAALVILTMGCASDDPENVSSRPWASPQGWEGGLPASINEGR